MGACREMQNENIQWIDCGPFANRSEELAKHTIMEAFGTHTDMGAWIVLSNLMSAYKPFQTPDEIDLVAIGSHGVLAVEIKHWDAAYIQANPEIAKLEAHKIEMKARRLAGRIKTVSPGVHVTARMLLTKANKTPLDEVEGVRLHVLKEIASLFIMDSGSPLTASQMNHCAEILKPTAGISLTGRLPQFRDIEDLTLISGPEERFHREYRGVRASARERVILHWYDLTAATHKKPEELAHREYLSYQLLQKEAFVPRIIDSFQPATEYPGEIYFFTISDPMAPTLRERSKDETWTREQRLAFSMECLRALSRMHSQAWQGEARPIFHRGLTPESILVGHDNNPIFIQFQWAKIADSETVSQGNVTKSMASSEYTPPEVIKNGLGIADGVSDIYALCESMKIMFSADEAVEILAQGTISEPHERIALDTLIDRFTALAAPVSPHADERGLPAPAYWAEGTDIVLPGHDEGDTRFRVLGGLGGGGVGRTFKVVQVNHKTGEEFGFYVAKTVNSEEDAVGILDSYRRVRPLLHDGAAIVYEIAEPWEPNKPLALLQWIEGDPLSSYAEVLSLYAEDLEQSLEELLLHWISQVCRALVPIHQGGYIHGDISPGNLIVSGSNITLTDYDAVTAVGQVVRRYNPRFGSPRVLQNRPVRCSDDIFSLAASMAEVLADRGPFLWGNHRDVERGVNPQCIGTLDSDVIREFLLRATSSEGEAFEDAASVIKFLATKTNGSVELKVPKALRPEIAPRLLEILQTYPGSLYGNTETRGLDSRFAEETYVVTTLDSALESDVVKGATSMIVLLGNAGDGKTALIQHLLQNLGLPMPNSAQRTFQSRLKNGKTLYVNLDGSASYDDRSSQDLLDEFFLPFMGTEFPDDRVHVLAINSGPLKQWLETAESSLLTTRLYDALMSQSHSRDPRVRVIDLNARSLVGEYQGEQVVAEFVETLFVRLIGSADESDPWGACVSCSAQSRCSAHQSVQYLRNPQDGPQIQRRFEGLLQMVHQRGEVHITARELRAALSYGFFGPYSCQDLHDNPDLEPKPFFHRLFDASAPGRQGELLEEVAWLDPAIEIEPAIDRQLLRQGQPLDYLRRQAYFFEKDEGLIPRLHQGKHHRDFIRLPVATIEQRQETLKRLLNGLSRLGGLPQRAMQSSRGLSLRVPARVDTESVFWVEKAIERFEIRVPSAPEVVPFLPTWVDLVYRNSFGKEDVLAMGLELFDFLLEASEGAQVAADIRSADIYARLSVFVQRLAEEDRRTMWAWNPIDGEAIYKIEADGESDIQPIRVRKEEI